MIYLTPLSLIPALFVWQWPAPSTFGALIGLGGLGTLAHLSGAGARGSRRQRLRAFRICPPALCRAYRLRVVWRGHRYLDVGGRGDHRRFFDLCRAPRGPAREARAPRRAIWPHTIAPIISLAAKRRAACWWKGRRRLSAAVLQALAEPPQRRSLRRGSRLRSSMSIKRLQWRPRAR